MSVFKSTLRTINVRPGILTTEKLKLIIPLLQELNEEAKKLEFESYSSNQTTEDSKQTITKETIDNAMPILISVAGEDGEFLFTDTLESLQDHLLPTKISRVVIDNSSSYRQLAKIDPLNTFGSSVELVGKIPEILSQNGIS